MRQLIRVGVITMAALLSGGCGFLSDTTAPGHIPIVFKDLDSNGECGSQIRLNNQRWNIDYFSFYLSEPRVKIDGRWQALSFEPNEYQSRSAALLQFHDRCESSQRATIIKLDASEKLLSRASSIRFTIGLPFAENHLLEDSVSPPVNNTAMFQSPRVGHSFMRLELKQTSDNAELWSFMLASGQCQAPSDNQAPTVCEQPNRITVDLPLKANVDDLRLAASLREILFRVKMAPKIECNLGSTPDASCNKVLRNLTSRPWIRWDAPHQEYLKQD